MNVLLQVIQNQWIFILLAALLIGAFYFVKAKKPEIFKKFAAIELIATIAALVIFALFKFQDLFLLAPIILISCELFGYFITGKVVGVLLVDYLLIIGIDTLHKNGAINDLFDTVLFYALQIATAVVVGILIDNHLKSLGAEKQRQTEAAKEQERLKSKKVDDHIDEIFAKYSGMEYGGDEEYVGENDKLSFDDESDEIYSSSDRKSNIINFNGDDEEE